MKSSAKEKSNLVLQHHASSQIHMKKKWTFFIPSKWLSRSVVQLKGTLIILLVTAKPSTMFSALLSQFWFCSFLYACLVNTAFELLQNVHLSQAALAFQCGWYCSKIPHLLWGPVQNLSVRRSANVEWVKTYPLCYTVPHTFFFHIILSLLCLGPQSKWVSNMHI